MDFDFLKLSRMQFSLAIAFPILFQAFTIFLAGFGVVCGGLRLKTGGGADTVLASAGS